jgi:biopolymer transport protein ExbD/biopolymer transport protein TolR
MHDQFTVTRPRQRLRPMAEMNVTSLVDVCLVLLIIFMLTAPFIQGGIDVALPKAKTPATAAIEGPVISLDSQRRIFLDDDQVPLARLAEVLREIRPAGSETPVYLRSDEEVPYGFVVRVMGEIKEGGVDDLSLVVEPEARGGS